MKENFSIFKSIASFLATGMLVIPYFLFATILVTFHSDPFPLIAFTLFYSFRASALLLIGNINTNFLLKIAIGLGIIGAFFGILTTISMVFLIISAVFLGICSGIIYPAYLSVSYHLKDLNNYKINKNESIFALFYGLLF